MLSEPKFSMMCYQKMQEMNPNDPSVSSDAASDPIKNEQQQIIQQMLKNKQKPDEYNPNDHPLLHHTDNQHNIWNQPHCVPTPNTNEPLDATLNQIQQKSSSDYFISPNNVSFFIL